MPCNYLQQLLQDFIQSDVALKKVSALEYPLCVLSWVIHQLFHTFLCKLKLTSLGAVDDLMHCGPPPSTLGHSASGHTQHFVDNSFDFCTERFEIVVQDFS